MNNEEAIKVLSESIHYGSKVPWDKIVEAVHLSIEALSQPSLPSNLDKAAEKYTNDSLNNLGAILRINVINAFKAGAKWMAGQGYTFETIMQEDDVDELVPTCPDMYNHGYSCSDKVIVQIRKK